MVVLYSLPNCGICNMVKTKLNSKKINFIEKDFQNIAEKIQSDHAPAIEIIDDKHTILNSPSEIVAWINKQPGD